MRVVSLVPSWTETLIEAGVEVVGRTRFCIHPAKSVEPIPSVGGTKQFNLSKLEGLRPDLVVFDREENTKTMYEAYKGAKWSGQVTDLVSLSQDMAELGARSENQRLREWSRWAYGMSQLPPTPCHWLQLPGLVKWVKPPPPDYQPKRLHYLIWKKPWMEVTQSTFIGEILGRWGLQRLLPVGEKKYPELSEDQMREPGGLVLLSSEPYPFERDLDQFGDFPVPVGLVDGEVYSWFGIRSLRFLENHLDQGFQ